MYFEIKGDLYNSQKVLSIHIELSSIRIVSIKFIETYTFADNDQAEQKMAALQRQLKNA